MEKPDLSQNISFKSLGVLFGYMFKVWVRRMVMFGVIAGTWGLLNATEIGFLKTIAPFAAFGLALVELQKAQSVGKKMNKQKRLRKRD